MMDADSSLAQEIRARHDIGNPAETLDCTLF